MKRFPCPECRTPLRFKRATPGEKLLCPECMQMVTVPQEHGQPKSTVLDSESSFKPKWIIIGTAMVGLVAALFVAVAKYYEIHKARAEAARAEAEAEKAKKQLGAEPDGQKKKAADKDKENPVTEIKKPSPSPFVAPETFEGRWKLVNDKGVTGSYLTVSKTGAKRDHAPAPGTWRVVGKDARITWEDGYRDIMRVENNQITYLGLGKANSWETPALFRLQAIRIK